MEFKKINELMNYNYESKGTDIYKIFTEFINSNSEIIDLKEAEQFLLPPEAFGDNRKRNIEDYKTAKQTIEELKNNKNYKRGMTA